MRHTLILSLCMLLLVSVSHARIERDDASAFVVSESVKGWASSSCGSEGVLLSAEGSRLYNAGGKAASYRAYSIALPGPELPEVRYEILASHRSDTAACPADSLQGIGSLMAVGKTVLGTPSLRQGTWVVDLWVPLSTPTGRGMLLVDSFRVSLSFRGAATGNRSAAGLVRLVANPSGASRFAESVRNRAGKRSQYNGTEWLADVPVGDRDHSTFQEDGFQALPWTVLNDALRSQGMDALLSGIPVRNIRMFAGPADTSAEAMDSLVSPTHLQEIPIEVRDHGTNDSVADGVFGSDDTLVFFATGTSIWKQVAGSDSMPYQFSASPYDFRRRYYIGVQSSGTAKRLAIQNHGNSLSPRTSALRFVRAEKDLLLRDAYFDPVDEKTGKEWFWVWKAPLDSLYLPASQLGLSQVVDLPGLVKNGWFRVGVGYWPYRSTYASWVGSRSNTVRDTMSMDKRYKGIQFRMSLNGDTLERIGTRIGLDFILQGDSPLSSGNRWEMQMLPSTDDPEFDRFDGFTVGYAWTPSWSSGGNWMLPGLVTGSVAWKLSGDLKGVRVLRVRDHNPEAFLALDAAGVFRDSIADGEDVRYWISRESDAHAVAEVEALPAVPDGVVSAIDDVDGLDAEYLIIAPGALIQYAAELGRLRSTGALLGKYRTAVVRAEDIYQFYSGGQATPVALRDYVRWVRSRWPSFHFLLLAADGVYDYRGLSGNGEALLPTYEREDMGTDDFFAVLDSGERIGYGRYGRDIAIGRLPVRTSSGFSNYLAKVKSYEGVSGEADFGPWRQTLILTADDLRQRDVADKVKQHTSQEEGIYSLIDTLARAHGFRFDVRKIYLLDYPLESSYLKPSATRDLVSRLDQGGLLTFYVGHGSSTDWADEGLFRPGDVDALSNEGRYTILGSFACTVGRFDLDAQSSLTELMINAHNKGAIAGMGGSRETFSNANENLAQEIVRHLLFDGVPLGDALLRAKGTQVLGFSSQRYNDERYVLLGEPTLTFPPRKLAIKLDQQMDTLQALDKVRISGTVDGSASNGWIQVQVLQGDEVRELNDTMAGKRLLDKSVSVVYQGGNLLNAVVPFSGGSFATEFITPAKMPFGDTAAEVRLWAWSGNEGVVGSGRLGKIAVSGTSSYADSIHDTDPPAVRIMPCSGSGGNGYGDGASVSLARPACLLVEIEDSTGIDVRSEADEGVVFSLTGYADPWHPSSFLEQTGRRLVAQMLFDSRYASGDYQFVVQAQDILGNRTSRSLNIQLGGSLTQGLADVFNVPNPMGRKGTVFHFKNLAEGRTTQATLRIFDSRGILVRVLQNVQPGVTRWDGRDARGRLLANGVYFYKLSLAVLPVDGEGETQVFERKQKLVISR